MREKKSAKHQVGLCIIMVVLVVLFIAGYEEKSAWVFVDGKQIVVEVPKWRNAIGTIKAAGVSLGENDGYVESPGNIIEVIRAVPVNIIKDGQIHKVWTSQPTVEQALAAAGVAARGGKIFPSATARPVAGMDIAVLKANEQILEEKQEIPFTVVSNTDSRMPIGESAVIAEGVKGSKSVLVKLVELVDGKILREELKTVILAQPKEQVVALGTANTVQTSRGSERFQRVMDMQATAYTPWDEGCTGITKMGIPAKRGIVAVDPDVIKLGTRLYIPGYGVALAADIGGAIVGNRIDLCMEDLGEAMQFGRRPVKVYIIE